MVHALSEIRRALTPGGILIDLRPLTGGWPIELASSSGSQEAGRLTDLEEGLEDERAANAALREGQAQGLFAREREETFPFFYYWDSPNEMKEYIDESWSDFITIGPETWKSVRSMWAAANADARLRVRLNMLITCWRKP